MGKVAICVFSLSYLIRIKEMKTGVFLSPGIFLRAED